MGFAISQNIFSRPRGGKQFSTFTFQAMILFSDHLHPKFANDFQGFFKDLNDESGQDVVFFAATRTPLNYEKWHASHQAFRKAQQVQRKDLTPASEKRLIFEISRHFGIDPSGLPAVVLALELWRPPYIVIPHLRSADEAKQILQQLTALAKYWQRPTDRRQMMIM